MECVICGEDAGKWGNNAQPVTEGQCCDSCNELHVIPKRMKSMEAFN